MRKPMKAGGGFTLIELMIVVAIIGIIASIAIPQYQNYVAKSQVSEGVSILYRVRQDVEVYMTSHNGFPSTLDEMETQQANRQGSMVVRVEIQNINGGEGELHAIFDNEVVPLLKGKRLVYARSTGGTWSCVPPSGGATDVPAEYLPPQCD